MGGFVDGMTAGAARIGGRHGNEMPRPSKAQGGGGLDPFHQSRIDAANGVTGRNGLERGVDNVIAAYNSEAVQNTLMVAPVGVAAMSGAVSAMAAGATGTAVLAGAATAAAPVMATVAVGAIAGMAGFAVGEFIGGHAMEAMGFQRIAGDGEMPATVGHPIAHTSGWSLGAMVLGAVAAVAVGALIVATGGAALVAVAAAAAVGGIGFGFASAAGQYGENKGTIRTGSPNVFFRGKAVARVTDVVDCSEHAESKVAEGAERVFANNWPIARIGHKTTCDGTINDGVASIAIDIDTSAIALDIDVGWANRAANLAVMLSDFLPVGGRRGPNTSTAHGGGPPLNCLTVCGDPIDVVSGRVIEQRTDLMIPATIPLRLERCHAPWVDGPQGAGWAGTWSQSLTVEGDTVRFLTTEGLTIIFAAPQDDVASRNLRFPHLELLGRRSGELFVLDRRSQTFLAFAASEGPRPLDRIADRNGNSIRFLRRGADLFRVEHSDGFALQIHSDGGRIRHAALEGGDCGFAWDYTADGHLREVRSDQTGALRYTYDAEGRITSWADRKATRVHYAYDAAGRVNRSWTDSGHLGVTIAYDEAARRSVATTSDGATVYDWTKDGTVWRETDPLGHAWITEWDAGFRVKARIDPLGRRIAYDYDDNGDLVAETDAAGHIRRWEYDAQGLMVTATDQSGNRTALRYDDRGNLAGMTDPLGRVTTFGHGAKGEITRIDRPGGVQERFWYDPLVRLARHRDPDGNEVRMGHDVEGRMIWFTDQIGATTHYDFARGAENPRGALRQVTEPNGTRHDLTYDIEGRLSRVSSPALDRRYSYGAFDLPEETTDAEGHRIRLEYDAELRLSAAVNERGERHGFDYDAAGRLVAERDFSGLTTRYAHDAGGRLVRKTAPDGTRTEYHHSGEGLARMVSGSAETRFAYDPRGLVTLTENAAARVEYAYDALGRVVSERLNGREITSAYSVAGHRIGRSGDVLHLTGAWSRAGLPVQMTIGDHAPLRMEHDPRGMEILRHSQAGFALAQRYGATGDLAQQVAGRFDRLDMQLFDATRLGAGMHRRFETDPAHRVTGIEDFGIGRTSLAYDVRGQVATFQRDGLSGAARARYEYDPARDLSAILEAGRFQPVETVAGRVRRRGHVTYRHDACGRVIEKRVEEAGFRPRVWRMSWDDAGQLGAVETPEGYVWHYTYDALGRRLSRICGERRFVCQWEGDHLIAEAPVAADGTPLWQDAIHWVYEPGSFRPLAQVQGGVLRYVATDHLGTPHELFSEDGSEVSWRGRPDLWGTMTANDNACPIRFQGQFHDAETGLHYNRFRYYDPDSTQYLSPDPIGLQGGIRPQGYVLDPNDWIDPLGLANCPRREVNGTTIFGTGQVDRTPGHDQFSEIIANKLAMSGKFDRIYLNRSYNLANGSPTSLRRPDILAIDRNGRYHPIEVASKTDTGRRHTALTDRNAAAIRRLPPNQRGKIVVLDHPYDAATIKSELDNLIGRIP